jgi:hypothetical protein
MKKHLLLTFMFLSCINAMTQTGIIESLLLEKGLGFLKEQLNIGSISEGTWRIEMLTTALKDLEESEKLQKITDKTKEYAEKTNTKIQEMFDLQQEMQKSICDVLGISWIDLEKIKEITKDFDINPVSWSEEMMSPDMREYFKDQHYAEKDIGQLYLSFGPDIEELTKQSHYFTQSGNEGKITDSRLNEKEEKIGIGMQNTYAIDETDKKVMLKAANEYERLSEELTNKAKDLEDALKGDKLKLTQGDQLQMYYYMNEYYTKSIEYKVKASAYRRKAAEKTDMEQGLYRDQLLETEIYNCYMSKYK